MDDSYFGFDGARMSLARHGYFEARAIIGRILSPRRRRARKPLLQIGAGSNLLPEFENLDFYLANGGQTGHVAHDVRRPLPYADATFEGVYSEHTLEHLYPGEAMRLLAEIRRVLKPGGIFRCSVPDLGKYVEFYEGRSQIEQFGRFRSGCEALWNLTQNHLHRSVWDADMLERQMIAQGFASAKRRGFREGADERLLVDIEHRAWESLYMEGVR